MVQWIKKNPFGAFLLNTGITILLLSLAICFFVNMYGDKINSVYENSIIIKDAVTKLKRDG